MKKPQYDQTGIQMMMTALKSFVDVALRVNPMHHVIAVTGIQLERKLSQKLLYSYHYDVTPLPNLQ